MATGPSSGLQFEVHPSCQCVSEPRVVGKPTERVSTSGLDPIQTAIADRALKTVESVHRYPSDMPSTKMVTGGAKEGARADFFLKPNGEGVVRFAEGDVPDTGIIIHELGHRIDAGIGGTNWVTRSAYQPATEVIDTIKGSNAFRTLVDSTPDEKIAGYYTNEQELFARAYAQWIGQKTGVKIGTDRDRELGIQWADDDFAPIARKLDALFRAEGLLVE
jgi:hypothetical protein